MQSYQSSGRMSESLKSTHEDAYCKTNANDHENRTHCMPSPT